MFNDDLKRDRKLCEKIVSSRKLRLKSVGGQMEGSRSEKMLSVNHLALLDVQGYFFHSLQ